MRYLLKSTLVDSLLALLLTILTVLSAFSEPVRPSGAAIALSMLSVAPIALRQAAPVSTMLVVVVALVMTSLMNNADGILPNGGIGMVIAMFSVATLRPLRVAAFCYGSCMGLLAFMFLSLSDQKLAAVGLAQSVVVMVGAWALGHSTRRWSLRSERLAADAARAVAEERVRIARELHDIVAHHMSVISLQAGVAEFVLDSDPVTAKGAIVTVGEASREAMLDMRRLLDVLRVDLDDEIDLHPQPGLGDLDGLVARARAAGVDVELGVHGLPREVPAGVDLCAFRTVQEALTNVLKHAGPAVRARIDVGWGEDTLTVRVTDDGTRVPAPVMGFGAHGIRGMRERAALYDGVLVAGPGESGGFEVLLRLPLDRPR